MPAVIIPDDVMDDGCSDSPDSCSYDDEFYVGAALSAATQQHSMIPQQSDDTSLAAFYGDGETHWTSMSLLRRDREKDGRCGYCGLQTHQVCYDASTGMQTRVALSVPNEVHRGRCLLCFPLPNQGVPTRQSKNENHTASYEASGRSNSTVSLSQSAKEMSFYHDPVDPGVRRALCVLQKKSIETVDILYIMKRIPYDAVVQERACERLWILSWEDDNAVCIGRVGGIPLLLTAMARFPHNGHLIQCACETLQNLCAVNDFNRHEVAELGGVALIVQGMMRHEKVAGIQLCSCGALANVVASRSKYLLKVLLESGALDAVMSAAVQFSTEESVLRAAYDVFAAMGVDASGRLPILTVHEDVMTD